MMSATPPENHGGPSPDGNDQSLAGPPSHQHPVPEQTRRPAGRSAWVLAGAIGVVVGLVVGVFVGSFFADGSAELSADGDVSTTCEYAAALNEDFDPEQIGLQDPTLWRLQAVAGLAQAAPLSDPAYQELGDQGKELMASIAELDVETIQATLQAMDETCQGL